MDKSKIKTKETDSANRQGTVEDCKLIEVRAYEIWCDEGCPENSAFDNWIRAEQELSKGTIEGKIMELHQKLWA